MIAVTAVTGVAHAVTRRVYGCTVNDVTVDVTAVTGAVTTVTLPDGSRTNRFVTDYVE